MSRLLDAHKEESDLKSELTLRPGTLKEYIGQEELKKNLHIFIEAAKKRNETLDHVLLYGPPGLGKTTMAYVIAHEMHGDIKTVNGPAVEKKKGISFLSMKSIGFQDRWKRSCIARWRILSSAS